jgi:hypothetical protein
MGKRKSIKDPEVLEDAPNSNEKRKSEDSDSDEVGTAR